MRFIRKAGAPSDKSPKRLYVEPAELARKLVKEMDDHVVERGEELWARNRYTIYLCREDYENLAPRAPRLIEDLRAKLAKHIMDEDYLMQGELMVELVLDEELELGYFGILAQKGGAAQAARESVPETPLTPPPGPRQEQPRPAAPVSPAQAAAAMPAAAAAAAAQPAVSVPPVDRAAEAAHEAAVEAVPETPAAPPQEMSGVGYTQVMPAAQADELGLQGRVIVITSGGQVMQFRQSRVVIGRSKEADLRVNDANVSRKHAAVYWNNGRIMIDDLGSTNGTMVNGYPVTRTMLRPNDVVAIGESRFQVEGR